MAHQPTLARKPLCPLFATILSWWDVASPPTLISRSLIWYFKTYLTKYVIPSTLHFAWLSTPTPLSCCTLKPSVVSLPFYLPHTPFVSLYLMVLFYFPGLYSHLPPRDTYTQEVKARINVRLKAFVFLSIILASFIHFHFIIHSWIKLSLFLSAKVSHQQCYM